MGIPMPLTHTMWYA